MEHSTRQEAEQMVASFLNQYTDSIDDYTNVPIQDTGLLKGLEKYSFGLTHFDDLYDTLLYSKLISKALRLNHHTRTLVDLGAGSSIPTLLAVKQSQRTDIETIAVDIDPEALRTSQENVKSAGLDNNYTFHHAPLEEAIYNLVKNPATLIVSNPPYIPVPEKVNEYHLVPVNGGEDGTQFMMDVLSYDYPEGATLALLWGSLTNPLKIIPLIEKKYEVQHVQAVRIHFGKYTKLPIINSHLYRLRDEGKVVFDVDSEKGETQIVIGTILKARKYH